MPIRWPDRSARLTIGRFQPDSGLPLASVALLNVDASHQPDRPAIALGTIAPLPPEPPPGPAPPELVRSGVQSATCPGATSAARPGRENNTAIVR